MKISVPSREHYAKIADITVKPQDAPKEENIELLYNSIPLKSELK